MDWKHQIAQFLVPQFFTDYDTYQRQVISLKLELSQSKEQLLQKDVTLASVEQLLAKKQELVEKLFESTQSPIDNYLSKQYKVIPNIAYKNKRFVSIKQKSKTLSGEVIVYLNQLITPDNYEVRRFFSDINGDDLYQQVVNAGDKLAKHTTWVDEMKLYDTSDFYLYPEETLTFMRKSTDCEDVSYTMASSNAKYIAVCYGYYHNGDNKFGHAYPIVLYKDKLYIVETTGNTVETSSFDDKRYETFFIITKEKTYQIKAGVRFGVLASWEE